MTTLAADTIHGCRGHWINKGVRLELEPQMIGYIRQIRASTTHDSDLYADPFNLGRAPSWLRGVVDSIWVTSHDEQCGDA